MARLRTRILDVYRQANLNEAWERVRTAHECIKAGTNTPPDTPGYIERATANLKELDNALAELKKAKVVMGRMSAARRAAASEAVQFGSSVARSALRLGGTYSGGTLSVTEWGEVPRAETIVSKGDRYSRGCDWRRNDATHRVTLGVAGLLSMMDAPFIEEARRISKSEGLVLLSARECPDHPNSAYQAVWEVTWVRRVFSHRIALESGWMAYLHCRDHRNRWMPPAVFHSNRDAGHALTGVEHKVRSQAFRIVTEASRDRKSELADAAREMVDVEATLADARRMGFCEPGIRAFQARHGIGNKATLPVLMATKDPDAMKLAMAIAAMNPITRVGPTNSRTNKS